MKSYFGPKDFQGLWSPQKKIIYKKRPVESWQCMPIGTGKTGATVWVPQGLCLQVNHSECWGPDGGLPSLIRMDIQVSGDPFSNALRYSQELDLNEAAIRIKADTHDGEVNVEIIAHPILDAIFIEIYDGRKEPGTVSIHPYSWRQVLEPGVVEDLVVFTGTNKVSCFDEINRQSGVHKSYADTLKGLSYGIVVWSGEGVQLQGDGFSMECSKENRKKHIVVAADVGMFSTAELIERLKVCIKTIKGLAWEEIKNSHYNWWNNFWKKSCFELAKDSKLQPASAVWHLSRYFSASSMAGKFPPIFDGSIFLYNYDRRSWHGHYVLQNMRLVYWPLFKCGDIDYLMPYFDIYFNALELTKERIRYAYSHKGVIFPEAMFSWGGGPLGAFTDGKLHNNYIKDHFTGSLELIMMMLEYYRYRKDRTFAIEKLLPMADEILLYFFEHFPIINGKLFIEKASALETWWEADNPADQVAGLKAILPAVLEVGRKVGYIAASITRWENYTGKIPELPRGGNWFIKDIGKDTVQGPVGVWRKPDNGNSLAPAADVHHLRKENWEDPELYSVWPFGLFGIGMPEYSIALETYNNRIHKEPCSGWSQTAIWAARLGLAEEASELLLKQFEYNALLPGGMMYSPCYKIIGRPDVPEEGLFDTVGAMATAVNEMLMQDYTGILNVLPAWPKDEEVYFKLHSASDGVIEKSYGLGDADKK